MVLKGSTLRVLIIIGGGILQVPLIQKARAMGLQAAVFDMSLDAPGLRLADHKVLMSTRDIEGCVRKARMLSQKTAVHGVITAGTDASRSVAAVASALELPGIRYADAEACSNKVLMRRRLKKHNLPGPPFYSLWSLKEAREAMDCLTFPLVLKPAENMGSRGVIKIEKREDIHAAFRHTKKYSPTGEMILEEYMPGPELSVDALAWDKNFALTGIADRIIAHEPFFIEIGHNMPSMQAPLILQESVELMRKAMRALGIYRGAAKGDLKITAEGVKIGEIAARLSGGFMSSHTYPLHSGVDVLQGAIHLALGDEPQKAIKEIAKAQSSQRQKNKGGFQTKNSCKKRPVAIERSILCPPGKIMKLEGVDRMRSVPGIEYIYISCKEGELIKQATSNIDKAGHIIATGASLREAELSIKKALRCLKIEVDKSYGVDWQAIHAKARSAFGERICWVCKVCDGEHCASGVPGMGALGQMESFKDNSRALKELRIVPRYIGEEIHTDTSLELFGRKFEYPIMAAPMTGAQSNMNGAIGEYELAYTLLKALRSNGSIAWVGDGASPSKYQLIRRALRQTDIEGFGIVIFKPRADHKMLAERLESAHKLGLLAVGIDIDAAFLKTMQLRKQASHAYSIKKLKELRRRTPLPFILKGIMSIEDAYAALEIGADAIVVSNHGGRVLDQMPGVARVLPSIAQELGREICILADGGVRSGQDAFKELALGARAVLVGRPAAIVAVGGGQEAVQALFSRYALELKDTMRLCGCASLEEIDSRYLLSASHKQAKDMKHQ